MKGTYSLNIHLEVCVLKVQGNSIIVLHVQNAL